jgi:hypothetical protein
MMSKTFLHDKSKILNSFNAQKAIVEGINKLPKGTAPTMMAIAHFYPNAFPSIDTLAKLANKSPRQIFYDLKKLKTAGFLKITNRSIHHQTSVYKIVFEALVNEAPPCNGLHPPPAMDCMPPPAMDCTLTDNSSNKQINKPSPEQIKNLIMGAMFKK